MLALNLLSSFLSDRHQTVVALKSKSQPILLEYGVSQGGVLGPLLYSLCTTPLLSVISKYPGIHCHFYADDTHIFIFFTGTNYYFFHSLYHQLEICYLGWLLTNYLLIQIK